MISANTLTKYTITESDNLETFLGIHIVKEREHLYLSQPGHINKILLEANIPKESPKSTHIPMHPSFDDLDQDASTPLDKKEGTTK